MFRPRWGETGGHERKLEQENRESVINSSSDRGSRGQQVHRVTQNFRLTAADLQLEQESGVAEAENMWRRVNLTADMYLERSAFPPQNMKH
jgi:hypothetical protein